MTVLILCADAGRFPWKIELHAAARLIAVAARKPGNAVCGQKSKYQINDRAVASAKRIADGAGEHSIGYVRDVGFPLHITAKHETKPSSLAPKSQRSLLPRHVFRRRWPGRWRSPLRKERRSNFSLRGRRVAARCVLPDAQSE